MQTPTFHDGLPRDPTSAKSDAIYRVKEITGWFKHVGTATPSLSRLRLHAIEHLRSEGMSLAEIAKVTGINENRLREIVKNAGRGPSS
jgi:hypothetical protein